MGLLFSVKEWMHPQTVPTDLGAEIYTTLESNKKQFCE